MQVPRIAAPNIAIDICPLVDGVVPGLLRFGPGCDRGACHGRHEYMVGTTVPSSGAVEFHMPALSCGDICQQWMK